MNTHKTGWTEDVDAAYRAVAEMMQRENLHMIVLIAEPGLEKIDNFAMVRMDKFLQGQKAQPQAAG
ncbi:MAG TPA: hypothetical protein VFB38_02270 [Chthonomonadaceae bacterium]|nr:hypothetical protein [Chthonomonadaceae bacterium]